MAVGTRRREQKPKPWDVNSPLMNVMKTKSMTSLLVNTESLKESLRRRFQDFPVSEDDPGQRVTEVNLLEEFHSRALFPLLEGALVVACPFKNRLLARALST